MVVLKDLPKVRWVSESGRYASDLLKFLPKVRWVRE